MNLLPPIINTSPESIDLMWNISPLVCVRKSICDSLLTYNITHSTEFTMLSRTCQKKFNRFLTNTGVWESYYNLSEKNCLNKCIVYLWLSNFAFDLSIIKVYEEAIVKVSLCFAFLSILYIKNTLIYFISKFRSLHRTLCYQYFLSCNKTADNRRSMWVCSLKLRKNFRGWRILFRHDMFIYVPV